MRKDLVSESRQNSVTHAAPCEHTPPLPMPLRPIQTQAIWVPKVPPSSYRVKQCTLGVTRLRHLQRAWWVPKRPGGASEMAETDKRKSQKFRDSFRNSKMGCFSRSAIQNRPEIPRRVGIASLPPRGAPATEVAARGQPFRPPCRGPQTDKTPPRGPKLEKSTFRNRALFQTFSGPLGRFSASQKKA